MQNIKLNIEKTRARLNQLNCNVDLNIILEVASNNVHQRHSIKRVKEQSKKFKKKLEEMYGVKIQLTLAQEIVATICGFSCWVECKKTLENNTHSGDNNK